VLTRVEALRALLRSIYADIGICRTVENEVVNGPERHNNNSFLNNKSNCHDTNR
jgi:hypothetical protein